MTLHLAKPFSCEDWGSVLCPKCNLDYLGEVEFVSYFFSPLIWKLCIPSFYDFVYNTRFNVNYMNLIIMIYLNENQTAFPNAKYFVYIEICGQKRPGEQKVFLLTPTLWEEKLKLNVFKVIFLFSFVYSLNWVYI